MQSQERAVADEIALSQSVGNLSLSDSEIFRVPTRITEKPTFAILLGGEWCQYLVLAGRSACWTLPRQTVKFDMNFRKEL